MAINLPLDGDHDEHDDMVEINTTPLIDVMLVLLIMLIITIPLQTHSIDLHLPAKTTEQPKTPPSAILINLDSAGNIQWDGKAVESALALDNLLQGIAQLPGQPEIHLQADNKTAYKYLAKVLAAAQRQGIHKIGIVQGVKN